MGECHRMCMKTSDGWKKRNISKWRKKYYEMDVLSLMQHEHRNHGFSVVAINNSNIPACYEYQVTAT